VLGIKKFYWVTEIVILGRSLFREESILGRSLFREESISGGVYFREESILGRSPVGNCCKNVQFVPDMG
jgi:hypothetical protein